MGIKYFAGISGGGAGLLIIRAMISSKSLASANCKQGNGFATGPQSYGQYKALFWDVAGDSDGKTKINLIAEAGVDASNFFPEVGDADDRDLGTGPIAIPDSQNVKELYLISHDGQRRLLLRRNKTQVRGDDGEFHDRETIQILKLRGFDAGNQHNFLLDNPTTYDGEIDTRACDYGEGFVCGEEATDFLPNYPGYKLAKDENDGWVNLFDEQVSIVNRNIELSPSKNPDYARAEESFQINPFIKMSITTQLAPHKWSRKLGNMLKDYSYSLQSSFDTRGFYLK
ncbi:MAG: hypothetical protein DLD55_01910 [candidate division SR1 bacterium]|nr:MAG: hypothetical protein DLD55_01910 [candidate division SR1 bacterium]